MPYIDKESRDSLVVISSAIESFTIKNAGEINYLITLLVKSYMNNHGEKYQNYNDCIGALEGAKLELYRRHVVPYEDIKLKENGDV